MSVRIVFQELGESDTSPVPDRATANSSLLQCTSMMHVTISDNGPGVPPAEVPNLFARMYTSTKAVDPLLAGTAGKYG